MINCSIESAKNFVFFFIDHMEGAERLSMIEMIVNRRCFVLAEVSTSKSVYRYDHFYGFIPLENGNVLYLRGIYSHSHIHSRWESFEYQSMPIEAARNHYQGLKELKGKRINWIGDISVDEYKYAEVTYSA